MALTDFLTEGAQIPEGSALKATTSQTVLPEWYTSYAQQVLANQQALGQQAYPTYQGPRVAGFTGDQQAGFNQTRNAANAYQPGLSTGTNAVNQGISALGSIASSGGGGAAAAQPYFSTAGNLAQQSTQNSGLSVAQPYLNQAGGSAANVSEYMNPYTDSVVNRIADLGTRNLTENLLPAIEGRYIASGQFNGTGKQTDTARAIRDVSADVLAQQNSALNQGYQQAQQTKLADLSRYGQLGATAGNLGVAQQNVLQGAAGINAGLGSSAGQLTQGDKRITMDAALGLGQLGSTAANLGGLAQQYGLTGANALGQIGNQQQALNQQNLDVGYADFLRQQGYPQEQINNMVNTFKGVATGVPSATQEVGIVPTGGDQTYKPSTASTIASALAGAGGLISSLKGL